MEIIKRLKEFRKLGADNLAGPSRKSFISRILNADVDKRLEGTVAVAATVLQTGQL